MLRQCGRAIEPVGAAGVISGYESAPRSPFMELWERQRVDALPASCRAENGGGGPPHFLQPDRQPRLDARRAAGNFFGTCPGIRAAALPRTASGPALQ